MVNIDGVSIKFCINRQSIVYIVEYLSEQLKNIIRKDLVIKCHGAAAIALEESDFYSYKNTISEFLTRYDNKKDEDNKKGLIGEFLSNILISNLEENLSCISLYFNKQDPSHRKAFDIVYTDNNHEIWYTEVKSGTKPNDKTASEKATALLSTAKNDIKKKLIAKQNYLWINAKADAFMAIENPQKNKSIQKALARDAEEDISKKNVIIVAVLFHDTTEKIEHEIVYNYLSKSLKKTLFNKLICFAIQKNTYTAIVDFLREELQCQTSH